MILDKLKAYGFMVLAGALAVLLGLQTWRLHAAQITLADNLVSIANVRTKAANALAAAEKKTRDTESTLNQAASDTRKETNEKITALTTRSSSLLDRVRLAEARAATAKLSQASAVASDGAIAGRSDGGELLRSFGTEDVAEATRAETIRFHLKACYTLYNRSAEALKQ